MKIHWICLIVLFLLIPIIVFSGEYSIQPISPIDDGGETRLIQPDPRFKFKPAVPQNFCGDKSNGYWCDGQELVRCSSNQETLRNHCYYGCQQASPGEPDSCQIGDPSEYYVYPTSGNKNIGSGWKITCKLGCSWDSYRGHLAEDYVHYNAQGRNDSLDKPIYAIANGTVDAVYEDVGNYLDIIVIKHSLQHVTGPGDAILYSRYGHMIAEVSVGQHVSNGQRIGRLGDPVKFVPHLHIEVVNPSAHNKGPFCNGCQDLGVRMSPGYAGYDFYAPFEWYEIDDAITHNRFYKTSWLVVNSDGAEQALPCSTWDGDLNGCNAHGYGSTRDCAYYLCSDACRPRGTSNCQAGCQEYCNGGPEDLPCSTYDGDVNACDAHGYGPTQDCAYYFCFDTCRPRGTSNCRAGCSGDCF